MNSKSSLRLKIIFFGTSSFAAFVLEQLVKSGHHVLAIVTKPDRAQGRHRELAAPPVKELALRICPHLPLFQPEKASDPAFADTLIPFGADLFVVVAYGEIIKRNLLEMPRLGCVNVHASLLPYFRGSAPMQRALMAGSLETGITIIEMSSQMDAGAMLAAQSIEVPEEMTLGELEEKLRPLAFELLVRVIDQFAAGSVTKTEQDHTRATFAPKLTSEEEKIDWKRPALEIHRQIRALSPHPGAWCQLQVGSQLKRLKIKRARLCRAPQAIPGAFISRGKEGWVIGCGSDALELQEVQLEGKKEMSAGECLRGLPSSIEIKI